MFNLFQQQNKLLLIIKDLKNFGLKFLMVGILATLLHYFIFVILIKIMWPELANLFAFLASFFISFFGHRYFTFNEHTSPIAQSLIKFFSAACLGFLNNELVLVILHRVFTIDSKTALICGMFTSSAQTFLLSRYWAFKNTM